MRETTPLFSEMSRSEPRKAGILPSQEIQELIRNGKIRSRLEIPDSQVQPASIDLRLGNVAHRVRASFLPNGQSTIGPKIRELQLGEINLSEPAELAAGDVFIVPLIESLELPRDMGGKANPKSTTGRLDIFTRLITECGAPFEEVPLGYKGDLYVEIVPRTFSIIVKEGTKLNQLRFFRGSSESDDEQLRKLAQKKQLVYYENGHAPERPTIHDGLRVSIDLQGKGPESIVAYKARNKKTPIDLAKINEYEVTDFWEAIPAGSAKSLVLDPGAFYLLASKERIAVPAQYAAEMESYDPSIGEFTVHYAGFFDPGFGYGAEGEIKGTKAVLEVRAHELPILLEDGQKVIRLMYHKMADVPEKLYGQAIGSSYQQQGLALSKQFKAAESARSAVPKS
jgi:dCTP deaminase